MSEVTRNATELFFQHSLADVIRKLRSLTNQSEAEAMEKFIEDTKKEVGSRQIDVKVVAVQKALYFHMMGFPSSYANFPIIECIADPVFYNKAVGYMAACCTFNDTVDVIPLMTSLLKRDLVSSSQYEVGMALYTISSVCSTDLAKDIVVDVVNLLHHPRPFVRKKAVLCLYKIFLQFPESLRPAYAKLKDKLDDSSDLADTDASVRGAVVGVLCELARRNPANFLGLAVPFFSMLQSEQSNWTLIKIIKVFGYFAPLEPRLGKKLVEPLTSIIQTTNAKSVQYECVLAVANGMSKVASLAKLAAEKIRSFIEDSDQNIRFLGLDALHRMVRDHKKLLLDQRDAVKRCLDDRDDTIKRKALAILRHLVTRKNCMQTVDYIFDRCLTDVSDEQWANTVIATIIETVRTDDYMYVDDFEWYLGVLLDMALLPLPTFGCGALVENELVTIMTRVSGIRAFGVRSLAKAFDELELKKINPLVSSQWRVLCAAAFVCGEYPHWVRDKTRLCRRLLSDEVLFQPAPLQTACVLAVAKIAAYCAQPCERHVNLRDGEDLAEPDSQGSEAEEAEEAAETAGDPLAQLLKTVMPATDPLPAGGGLGSFCHSALPDVQERACLVWGLLSTRPGVLPGFFAAELLPVAAGSQGAVEAPEGLDLERPFCADMASLALGSDDSDESDGAGAGDTEDGANFDLEYRVEQQRLQERDRREQVSAFYLRDGAAAPATERPERRTKEPAPASQHRRHNKQSSATYAINRDLHRPAHYDPAKALRERGTAAGDDRDVDEATRKFRGIDVTRALTEDEKLPEPVTYAQLLGSRQPPAPAGDRRRRHGPKATEAAEAAQLLLLGRSHLCVELSGVSCKAKRHALVVKGTLTVRCPPRSSAALSDGALSWDAAGLPHGVTLSGPGGDGGAAPLAVFDSLRAGEQRACALRVELAALPERFGVPLLCTLAYRKEKRARSVALELPLLSYSSFAQRVEAVPSPSAFESALMASSFAAEAEAVTAFLPCERSTLMKGFAEMQSRLLLAPVEVFKDAVSLYGEFKDLKGSSDGSGSGSSSTVVAVFLREAEGGDGVKGVLAAVRAHRGSVCDAVLDGIRSALSPAA